jgi:hypothetical protein
MIKLNRERHTKRSRTHLAYIEDMYQVSIHDLADVLRGTVVKPLYLLLGDIPDPEPET